MKSFIEFIKTQGVVGLAVGFILSTQISQMVSSIVNDLINPFLGLFLGIQGNLDTAYFSIGKSQFMWGNLVNTFINFLIVASLLYVVIKALRLEEHLPSEK
jgi:large conductance mechanosensitive channel